MKIHRMALAAAMLMAAPIAALAQANPAKIQKSIDTLREQPDEKRPAVTLKLAMDIRTLPPGEEKLKLADSLSHLATEGDAGKETMQGVVDTLTQALKETPQPLNKVGKPAEPYVSVAKYVRYEGVKTMLDDPQYTQAMQDLVANDVDALKADFTLKDMNGKKVTLSELKGKIVLVSFWATWCPSVPQGDGGPRSDLHAHEPEGLVILSITNENPLRSAKCSQQLGGIPPTGVV